MPPRDQATVDLGSSAPAHARCLRTGPRPLLRRLRDHPRAGPRRHGRRLPGPADQPQPHRRAQDDPRRPACQRDRRQAVLHRGRGRRQPRPPGHRADLRGRPARGPALLLDGLRRGPEPVSAVDRRAAAAPRGGRADGHGRRGDRLCPPVRRDSPRPQAGQHPARPEGQPAGHRLRAGEEDPGRQRADRLGSDHGHAQLHAAGAGRGQARQPSGRRPTCMPWERRCTLWSPAGRRSRRPRRWTRCSRS